MTPQYTYYAKDPLTIRWEKGRLLPVVKQTLNTCIMTCYIRLSVQKTHNATDEKRNLCVKFKMFIKLLFKYVKKQTRDTRSSINFQFQHRPIKSSSIILRSYERRLRQVLNMHPYGTIGGRSWSLWLCFRAIVLKCYINKLLLCTQSLMLSQCVASYSAW